MRQRPIFDYIAKVAGPRGTLKTAAVNVSAPECIGWSQGQTDLIVRAWDGTQVGSLRYCTYQDEIHVQNIEVDPEYRRQGLATTMWSKMVAEHPGMKINPGMFTDEGSAWWRSMTPSQRGKTGSLHEAGPGSGVIPMRVRAEPPANPRRPRPVVVDPVAAADIRDLDQGDQKKVRQIIKRIERGEVEVERKHRPPLQDCFTVDVGYSLRLLMYLNTDGAWHIAYAGYHDYDEAERRMVAAASKQAPRLFHGTPHALPIGTVLVPGGPDGTLTNGGANRGRLVWLTPNPAEALDWASTGGMNDDGTWTSNTGHAYEVDTTDAIQISDIPEGSDKPYGAPGAWVSPAARIIAEVGPRGGRKTAAKPCRYSHPERIAAAEHMLEQAKDQPKESRREHMRSIANGALRNIRQAMETCPDCSGSPVMTAALRMVHRDNGKYGRRDHMTYEEQGTIPVEVVRNMPGWNKEVPGEHRNRLGQRWEDFKADLEHNGMRYGIFIMVSVGEPIRIWEGNHRRDAAVELGWDEIPVQIRYTGLAEQDGLLMERYAKGGNWMDGYADTARIAEEERKRNERWGVRAVANAEHTALKVREIDGVTYTWRVGLDGMGKVVAILNDRFIGGLEMDIERGQDVWTIVHVTVNEAHRRKGIASTMLAYAREMVAPRQIVHSENLTSDGEAWSQRVGAKWNGSTDTEEQVRAWLAEVVHKDYPRGAGGCMVAAQVIAKDMGWPAVDGVFYEGPSIEHAIGAEKVYSHWWNVMPNGDIFDGTAGQFHPSGDIIRIVKRSDPDYKRYLSWQPGRSQWWERLTKDQQEELDNVTQYAYPHFGSKTAALSTEGMEILMAAIESREPVEVIYWSQPGWAMTSKGTVVGGTSTSINLSNWPDKDIAWADIISVKPADMAVAASSWRPFVAEAYWDAHDVTISSDGGASGRKAYEIHVGGKPWANRPSLTEAKAAVEEEYGPQDWKTLRTDKVAIEHYHFGETTEFTAPTTIWAADFT